MSASLWLAVFDLDGTLIDSSLDLCLAVNAALAHVGRPALPQALVTSYVGDGAATLIRRALGPESNDQVADEAMFRAALTHFFEFYRRHKLDNTCLHEGVLEALTRICRELPQVRLAVLTNKPVNPSREICHALGLDPFFWAVYGGDSFETKKPHPAGLQWIIEQARRCDPKGDRSQTSSQGVVMVGDSATDVLTARAAGTLSLGCRYGLAPESMVQTPPDLWCDHPGEWPEILERLGSGVQVTGQSQAAPRTPLASP